VTAINVSLVVVASDVDHPGWEACVDGKQVSVMRANPAFGGIVLHAGSHVVELSFRPRSVSVGAGVSEPSLLATGVLRVGGVRATRVRWAPAHAVASAAAQLAAGVGA
jgi:Bacterial membrane protein YfhO